MHIVTKISNRETLSLPKVKEEKDEVLIGGGKEKNIINETFVPMD